MISKRIRLLAVALGVICLMPATSLAGVAMSATANGISAVTGGRGQAYGYNITRMVIKESNALHRVMYTDATSIPDAIFGIGASDINAKGYLQGGPENTLIVFDFLAAQTLMQVVGFDASKLFVFLPGQLGNHAGQTPDLPGDFAISGGLLSAGEGAILLPPETLNTPEPASVVLLGLGSLLLLARRRPR